MATAMTHAVVSVDGLIADDNDDMGPLFDWYFNGDQPLSPEDPSAPGGMAISNVSYDYTRPMWDSIGATIMGRHLTYRVRK